MLIIGMNKQDILSIRCNDKDSHEKVEKLWYNHRIKTREEINSISKIWLIKYLTPKYQHITGVTVQSITTISQNLLKDQNDDELDSSSKSSITVITTLLICFYTFFMHLP